MINRVLGWLSYEDVREMLDANELSPRSMDRATDDDDDQPDEAQEWQTLIQIVRPHRSSF